VAIADVHVAAAGRDDGAGGPAERLAAPGPCRLAGRSDRQQQFAGRIELGHRVRAVIDAPDRTIGRDRDAVGAWGEDPLAEAALEAARRIELDDRMLGLAGERVDVIAG